MSPYVKVNRDGAGSTTVYLPWDQVVGRGVDAVASEALSEPGVDSVELLDNARTRVLFVARDSATFGAERVGPC